MYRTGSAVPTGGQYRHGAVLADSAPPARINASSPALIREAACAIASNPDPHWRSTVTPGTESPRPAASADTLAMLPPGPRQLPMITSSIGRANASTCSATAVSTGEVSSMTSQWAKA